MSQKHKSKAVEGRPIPTKIKPEANQLLHRRVVPLWLVCRFIRFRSTLGNLTVLSLHNSEVSSIRWTMGLALRLRNC